MQFIASVMWTLQELDARSGLTNGPGFANEWIKDVRTNDVDSDHWFEVLALRVGDYFIEAERGYVDPVPEELREDISEAAGRELAKPPTPSATVGSIAGFVHH